MVRSCESGPTPAESKEMTEDINRQSVLKFFDAYYSGDIETAMACCDEDFETITYAPVDLFPHLGRQHGKAWVGEAIRTQQKRYKNRKYELKLTLLRATRSRRSSS